jgi:CRISPR-associated endonuclease Csy4
MDHYVDIDLHPDPETASRHILGEVFARVHRELAQRGDGRIGVSFPGMDLRTFELGRRLRLHSNSIVLKKLPATDWLGQMRDHVKVSEPLLVPIDVRYRVVQRIQTKSSPQRLRRRLMRRHALDEIESSVRIPDEKAKFTRLPYLQLRSASTGQSFRLFVAHGPLGDVPTVGRFSSYGFSQFATIPWF